MLTDQTLQEAATSVFRYVERTAEPRENGIRWQTLNYENRPYYGGNVFNGAGGIPLFLAEYFRLTGEQRALDLAIGGAQWATWYWSSGRNTPDRQGPPRNVALCFGSSGVALAWLHLAAVTGDASYVERARKLATWLLPAGAHPVADFLGGAAGEGIFLLRLAAQTGSDEYLQQAVDRAVWLHAHAHRDDVGTWWPWRLDDKQPVATLGFAHGITGIAHFFVLLYQVTQDARWSSIVHDVAQTVRRFAVPDADGLNWPYVPPPQNTRGEMPLPCRWCHGAPGIGLFFAKAHEVLGDPEYLDVARSAGETTYAYGDVRHNPCQCHGLAGNAELFVELYRITRDPLWLERAHDFAQRCLAYHSAGPEGDTWQADEPGIFSPDFMCGASGTGHFFLRLLSPDTVNMPLQ